MDCFYYVVDRQAQTIFWIDDLSTEDVGLPPVVSPSHLSKFVRDIFFCDAQESTGTALEKEFWQHTDRFPAHFGGLPEESLLKLLDTFAYIRLGSFLGHKCQKVNFLTVLFHFQTKSHHLMQHLPTRLQIHKPSMMSLNAAEGELMSQKS
jgi:hypothetical protein